jgi:glycosyltransferase involved in cell wall biosynthesis
VRIVHVTDVFAPHVGGIETFVQGLATRQLAAGHEVTVLTRTPEAGSSATGPAVRRVHLAGGGALIDAADVVHVHLSVLSPLATLATRRAAASSIPTVASVHSLWAGRYPLVRAAALTADWQRAPILWTPVSALAETQVRRLLPDAHLHVVPNAVDVDWWRALAPRPAPVPTLLTTMRLVARKRPRQFLRMVAGIRRALPGAPFRVVVVGTGPLAGRLQDDLHRLGLAEQVLLAGHRSPEEIRELCAQAYAYVAPATLESFGIAALEARTAGLPVVAMKQGGVAGFVRPEIEGLLCDDDRDMVRALVRLLTDPGLRDRIARHNSAVAPDSDWSDTLTEFRYAYAQAARLAQAPGGRRAWASA